MMFVKLVKAYLGVGLLCVSGVIFAQDSTLSQSAGGVSSLDQLLLEVKSQGAKQRQLDKRREQSFLAAKDQQAQLLRTAKQQLASAEARSAELKKAFENNEAEIVELTKSLQQKTSTFGELFGVVRQSAGDLKAVLEASLITAQFPERADALNSLANSEVLPSIEELNTLWFSLQQEIIESGKVVSFSSSLIAEDGSKRVSDVVRIGGFNAIADGKFLDYLPDSQSLLVLPRQPRNPHRSLAENITELDARGVSEEYVAATIDPTRGSILGLIVKTPSVSERIAQGGLIGYIILAIGLVGIVIASARLLSLVQVGSRLRQQMKQLETISEDNPLGRVLAVSKQYQTEDLESLEMHLDEAILKETPLLTRGVRIIKLLAAIAPLLGLLGTVTGMIETFQSITLFGTGDPKLMADGISQALVTTMLGLIVAVPLLFLHASMAGRSQRMIQILDEQSAGIIARQVDKRAAHVAV